MKQTHHIGYVQTPSVKNLSNVKNALVENGLVSLTTPNEMLPDAIEKGLVEFENEILNRAKDYGIIYEGKFRIRYFDIDGTILKIEYVENGGKLTPPDNPSYDSDYLIFDKWNYDIENYIVYRPTDIGAIYDTIDGSTYMFCRFSANTGLNPTLAVSNFTSIDWGDGSVNTSKSHTYAKDGEYIIKINGEIKLYGSTTTKLFGSEKCNQALKKIYIGTNHQSHCDNMVSQTYNLEIISLPHNLKQLQNSFNYLNKLSMFIIPPQIKTIQGLSSIVCKYISLPDAVTNFATSGLTYCSLIKDIIISKSVISIDTASFKSMYAENIFIYCENIPKLTAGAFDGNDGAIFWVKDNIIEQLKVATNWSNYASQLKPQSWYPSLTDPNAE